MMCPLWGMTYYAPIPRLSSSISYVSITMQTRDSADDLLVRHVRLLRDCVALSQQRWQFGIEAAVVLPSEVQLLCAFSDADFGVKGAIELIKATFCRHLSGAPSRTSIWADTTEIVELTDASVPLRRAFIERAPVRAGLVKANEDWPYSSSHKASPQGTALGVAVI